MDEDEDERSRLTSQASTVGRTHGRNNSLSVASPSRLVAGFGLGGDGSMGRGVQNIAQGDEVVGKLSIPFQPRPQLVDADPSRSFGLDSYLQV
jgi:hypothetical protein